ncbi:tRNA (adenosine(37)-N6)-dimethylallyltransferase MiaA [Phaeovibrio sulfidiphilus]|uniref:tRNA dimethylallyltransferase n=1 Tax=Phaeovibrio sulfidiphilus TaxID=1220600 RepID=A0A8J6YQC6_9PROT|nr:tRNA (adenosine(37)-N6)-dimethylallyltransferase MiaA [Phaeovibrio sulfidiphilus]
MTAEAPFLVIAGPTASGKSALALTLAERLNGTIINADSMQVYADLRILSARPDNRDLARVPHRLYGVLDGSETGSVARWLEMAREAVAETRAAGRLPVLCGGTGLYIRAALEGLSALPPIPDPIRESTRRLARDLGPAALHARLQDRDPAMAALLRPGDTQRIVRAWEMLEATGRSLREWWADPPAVPGLPGRGGVLVLDPPREDRRQACDARLEAMIQDGALDEVAALLKRGLDPSLPVMRAVGVPELARAATGECPLSEALDLAKAATRQYAKRQATWLRHQLRADVCLPLRWLPAPEAQHPESLPPDMANFIRLFLLTDGV